MIKKDDELFDAATKTIKSINKTSKNIYDYLEYIKNNLANIKCESQIKDALCNLYNATLTLESLFDDKEEYND